VIYAVQLHAWVKQLLLLVFRNLRSSPACKQMVAAFLFGSSLEVGVVNGGSVALDERWQVRARNGGSRCFFSPRTSSLCSFI